MSLENKIELLTAAIDRLNANLALVLTTPANQTLTTEQVVAAPVEVLKAVEQVNEAVNEVVSSQVQAVTHNDLQSLILAKVRVNMEHKAAVKALLSEFGAAKVTDLKESDLAAVAAKVNAL